MTVLVVTRHSTTFSAADEVCGGLKRKSGPWVWCEDEKGIDIKRIDPYLMMDDGEGDQAT
jgi:hypothetical protein